MSSFLIISNLHLGSELFGAIVFFLIAWLFFEAFLIKKDVFSFSRALGFGLISLWQFLHALGEDGNTFLTASALIYLGGLILVLISYASEKLAGKPYLTAGFFFLPLVFKNFR